MTTDYLKQLNKISETFSRDLAEGSQAYKAKWDDLIQRMDQAREAKDTETAKGLVDEVSAFIKKGSTYQQEASQKRDKAMEALEEGAKKLPALNTREKWITGVALAGIGLLGYTAYKALRNADNKASQDAQNWQERVSTDPHQAQSVGR